MEHIVRRITDLIGDSVPVLSAADYVTGKEIISILLSRLGGIPENEIDWYSCWEYPHGSSKPRQQDTEEALRYKELVLLRGCMSERLYWTIIFVEGGSTHFSPFGHWRNCSKPWVAKWKAYSWGCRKHLQFSTYEELIMASQKEQQEGLVAFGSGDLFYELATVPSSFQMRGLLWNYTIASIPLSFAIKST